MTEARARSQSHPPSRGSGAPDPGILWGTVASDPRDPALAFTQGGVGDQGPGCSHPPLWLPAEPPLLILTICSWQRGPGLDNHPKEASLGVTADAPESHLEEGSVSLCCTNTHPITFFINVHDSAEQSQTHGLFLQ